MDFLFLVSQRNVPCFRRLVSVSELRQDAAHTVRRKAYFLAAQLSKQILSTATPHAEKWSECSFAAEVRH
jgi:hypothetical protein